MNPADWIFKLLNKRSIDRISRAHTPIESRNPISVVQIAAISMFVWHVPSPILFFLYPISNMNTNCKLLDYLLLRESAQFPYSTTPWSSFFSALLYDFGLLALYTLPTELSGSRQAGRQRIKWFVLTLMRIKFIFNGFRMIVNVCPLQQLSRNCQLIHYFNRRRSSRDTPPQRVVINKQQISVE